MWGKIRLLHLALLRLWRRWNTLDCRMSNLPDTLQILLTGFAFKGLEHNLGILNFRPTWPCLMVEVLATRVKFLEPFDYYTMINCTFTFCTTNVFGFFRSVMTQFELVKYKFFTTLHVHICTAFKSHTEWSNKHVGTPIIMILYKEQITCCKLVCTKILQDFLLTLSLLSL